MSSASKLIRIVCLLIKSSWAGFHSDSWASSALAMPILPGSVCCSIMYPSIPAAPTSAGWRQWSSIDSSVTLPRRKEVTSEVGAIGVKGSDSTEGSPVPHSFTAVMRTYFAYFLMFLCISHLVRVPINQTLDHVIVVSGEFTIKPWTVGMRSECVCNVVDSEYL